MLNIFKRIDGKNLKSIDLVSSQPLLFANVLKQRGVTNADLDKLYNVITTDDIYTWFLEKFKIYNNGSSVFIDRFW